MMRRAIVVACVAAAVSGTGLLAALAAPPPSGTHRYRITRNGDPIGTHRVQLRARGDRLAVQHEIDIRVSIAGWDAYRYQLSSAEFWSGDRLTRLSAYTNKNGAQLRVSATAAERHIQVRGAARARAPLDAVPASPAWNVLERAPRTMIDAEDGRMLSVRVSELRRESVRAGNRRIDCRCYRVTGGLDARLCYGPGGVLVRKQLEAPDGSRIEEVLR